MVLFLIDATSGIITVAPNANLDYETQSIYNIAVSVSDGKQQTIQNFTLNVRDINEAPTARNDQFNTSAHIKLMGDLLQDNGNEGIVILRKIHLK